MSLRKNQYYTSVIACVPRLRRASPSQWCSVNENYCVFIYYENIFRTSAVSSTNFGWILRFTICVGGSCNVLCGWVYIGRGPISKQCTYMFCCSPLHWLVYGAWPLTHPGVQVDRAVPEVLCSSLISIRLYKYLTVFSTILLYRMFGRWYFFLFIWFNVESSTNTNWC